MKRVVCSFILVASVACGGAQTQSDANPTDATKAGRSASGTTNAVLSGDVQTATDDVVFTSRNAELKGTILRPHDDIGRRPGVLIVHDWGPQGRDGIMRETFGLRLPVEVAVYRSLGERLSERGFVVLSYDKRTCTEASEPWCTYPRSHTESVHDELANALVDDANAARELLAKQPDVDPNRIVVIGHGHGAEVALEVDAASYVLLAPSPLPIDALISYQNQRTVEALEARIAADGSSPATDFAKKQLAAVKKEQQAQATTFDLVRRGTAVEETYGLSDKSWTSFFKLHDQFIEGAGSVDVPVLAIMAGRSFGMPDDASASMETMLNAKGMPREMLVLPDLTHLMVDVGSGQDSTRLSPDVVKTIIDFTAQ